jgi:putative two-component system response regulator
MHEAMPRTILLVDDTVPNLKILDAVLSPRGYRTVTAVNGQEALAAVASEHPDLILCDIVMPVMDGYEFCRRLRDDPATRLLPLIMMTASGEQEKIRAIEAGADDFVVKPFNQAELLARVRSLLRVKDYQDQIQTQATELAVLNQTLEQRVAERTQQLEHVLDGTVQAVALTVEMRDPYTAGHQRRVSQLAAAIARQMDLSPQQVQGILISGTLHDIGKIATPAEILSKPGKISEHEFAIIKTHPAIGYEILRGIEFPWPVATAVHQHHERLDGSGYPLGLAGQDILLESRILSVADVVEAISSHRPYRPSLGIDVARAEITKYRGTIYDAAVVDACLMLLAQDDFRLS